MRAADFRRVEGLILAREHLLTLKDEGRIEVSIGGVHQNRDFVGHVETAIRLELRYRINEIEQQLADLGVTLE